MTTLNLPWLESTVATLDAAIAAGRTPQAVLIHGSAGTGRRQLAAWLAARLLALRPTASSASDEALASITHPDLQLLGLEDDKKQINVAQVRELIAFLSMTSHQSGRKVALIHPADALNTAAANALLKTLEEPPGASTLILVSTSLGRLPATIVSRCQPIRVPPPAAPAALGWLRRQPEAADGGLPWEELLELAGGGPLRALDLARRQVGGLVGRLSSDLRDLMEARESPIVVARRWSKEDLEVCLDWLCVELRRRLRRGLNAEGTSEKPANAGSALLQIGQRTVTMTAGFAYLDRLLLARRQLDRSLNQELQLADLLMWWFGPATHRG